MSRTVRGVPQLPLALRYPPDQRLEAFVRAPAGAAQHLRALAEGEAIATVARDALYLAGPAGVGKVTLAGA